MSNDVYSLFTPHTTQTNESRHTYMNSLFHSFSHQKLVSKFVTIRVEIHAYVSHYSFICVTLLLHMCEITHSSVTLIGIINHRGLLLQTRTHLIRVCHYNDTKWRGILVAERWGAGVETQKDGLGEVGGWGRVPFNEPYAPSLSTIDDGA